MSRQIQGTIHNLNTVLTNSEKGRLIVTVLSGQKDPSALLIRDNRLLQVCPFADASDKVGTIYLGKVKNVQKNIDACFVEIADRELVYLPLSLCKSPFLANRSFDGRILEGDELVVQIERAAQKTKQAAATAKITLQGRYAVFSTGSCHTGISARLSSEERKRITELLQNKLLADDKMNWIQMPDMPSYGTVIRTEAMNATDEQILKELKELEESFLQIFKKAVHTACFTCLSPQKEPWEIAIEQIPVSEYSEIVTDLPDLYAQMQSCLGERNITIRLYEDASYPLRSLYGLDSKLQEALSRRIWLKSGSYLVFDTTEALAVFDVNSGKYDARKTSADTFYKINMEAAKEIALQIRLRNLSGIILADFINMTDANRQVELLNYMRSLVKLDPIHTTAVDITPLGLMEITRKKVNKTLAEQFNKTEGKS